MTNITASMVAQLREITGMGMMECKKALLETSGDIKKAEELIRIKSGAKASKMASRTAAEGTVAVYISDDLQHAALLEVNCETDFVAKDVSFVDFADQVAQAIVVHNVTDLAALAEAKLAQGMTVEERRKELIAKLGENISLRRFELLHSSGHIASYLHGKKIGVIVDCNGGDVALGRDIAMHIAAAKPICVSQDNVPAAKIEEERNIYSQQAAASGKPEAIVAKMVDGRIAKFLAEITLLGQNFVKNPDLTIAQLLTKHEAKVNNFVMFSVGEGIVKKTTDYAAEVAAVVNSAK